MKKLILLITFLIGINIFLYAEFKQVNRVKRSGDTMTGDLDMGGNDITNLTDIYGKVGAPFEISSQGSGDLSLTGTGSFGILINSRVYLDRNKQFVFGEPTSDASFHLISTAEADFRIRHYEPTGPTTTEVMQFTSVPDIKLLLIDWSASDDGSGSELDADLLDSNDSLYFAVKNDVASATSTLRTDLTNETNNRITADNSIATDTATLRTDLNTEISATNTDFTNVATDTATLRTDVDSKQAELSTTTWIAYDSNRWDGIDSTSTWIAADSNLLDGRDYLAFVSTAGDTMSGELNMGSNKIVSVTDPTADQDAATKKYVDDNIGGSSDIIFAYSGDIFDSTGTFDGTWATQAGASLSVSSFWVKIGSATTDTFGIHIVTATFANPSWNTFISSFSIPSGVNSSSVTISGFTIAEDAYVGWGFVDTSASDPAGDIILQMKD